MWWWLALAGAVLFGLAQLYVPEWLIDARNGRRQAKTDAKWAEMPHNEAICDDCGAVACQDCPGMGFLHKEYCSHYYPSL